MIDIEQKAFRITLLTGGAKGFLYALIPVIVLSGKPIPVLIGALLIGLSLGLMTEYLWYNRPNIEHHKILIQRLGSSYEREFRAALAELGLAKMLQQQWFVKKYKKHWAI